MAAGATGCAIVTTSHYNPDFSGVGTINAVQTSQTKVVKNIDSSLDPDTALDIYGRPSSTSSIARTDRCARTIWRRLAIEEEIATGSSAAPNTMSAPFGFGAATRRRRST